MTGDTPVLQFVVAAFATFRLTRLIVKDSFPPIAKFRSWLLSKWPDTPDFATYAETRQFWREAKYKRPYALGYLFSCVYCMSAYVSLAVCALIGVPVSRHGFVYWLSVWGAAVIVLVRGA